VLGDSYTTLAPALVEAEIAFGPGKVAFNDGAKAFVKAPLINKEQGCHCFLSLATQAVINEKAGAQGVADETHIEIPDSIAQAMRLPLSDQKQQLLIELAVALYARDILSFGKARELAGLSKYEFGLHLGRRGIHRRCGAEELQDDSTYTRGQ
jgi:predicted HTH domain antitoxin